MVAIKVGPPTAEEAVDDGFDYDKMKQAVAAKEAVDEFDYVKMVEYQKQVIGILNTISKNPIGKVITDFVLQQKKLLRIEPLYKGKRRPESVGEDNALTHPVKTEDSAPKGASERGPNFWFAGRPDIVYTTRGEDSDERNLKVPKLVGTGAGSDVVIYFTPELIKAPRVWDRRADNVLVHELVHALRVMQGLRNPIPTKNSDWMNEEEFWACVVQDVYLSAAGSTRLRYGYGDYESLMEAPMNTSAGFLKSNSDLFVKHAVSWGQVYTGLAMVNTATFNPFRAFVFERL